MTLKDIVQVEHKTHYITENEQIKSSIVLVRFGLVSGDWK